MMSFIDTLIGEPWVIPCLLLIIIALVAAVVFLQIGSRRKIAKFESELEHERSKSIEVVLKARNRFLATVSHEIRTPITAIIGVSDIELDCDDHPPETKDSFERINNSSKTLLGIINDILDLSRIESGKFDFVPVKYDMARLIGDTVRLNIMRIGGKDLEFKVSVAETLPSSLYGDELRIKQILNNILSNAIKYTKSGSVTFEIDQKTEGDDVTLIFTISDTGYGMTREQLERLGGEFEMFNRETNRETEGTGLGMSITKNLIAMMRGKLEVESEVDVGSVFKVYIPQKSTGAAHIGKELATNLENFKFTASVKRGKLVREYMPYGSVLLVDDNEANLFVAQGLLRPYGLTVESAISGYEAIEKIVNNGMVYDIIFMDHMMPGIDGIETFKWLREEEYTGTIIALTANAVAGQREMFLEVGFNDFISKPIDPRRLNAALNEWIRDKKPADVVEAARREKDAGDIQGIADAQASKYAEKAAAIIDKLKAINEIDVDGTLETMSGLTDVYVETVKLTTRLLPDTISKIDAAITSGDMKYFAAEMHGLKSVMRNIGASSIGSLAARIQHASEENNKLYCDVAFPKLKLELSRLYTSLVEAFEDKDTGEKKSADKSKLADKLWKIKTAVEGFERDDALEMVNVITEYTYDNETNETLKAIEYALEAFDCREALKLLVKLEGSINEHK